MHITHTYTYIHIHTPFLHSLLFLTMSDIIYSHTYAYIHTYTRTPTVETTLSQKEMDDIAGAIGKPIGIKQLLMVTEMARQGEEKVSTEKFVECLHICGF